MNADHSQQTLERLLADLGVTLARVTVAQGFALMFDFYRRQRAQDCPPENDGDKLESGNKWCPEPRPPAVDLFEGFLRGSGAYRAAMALKPAKVELDYFNAG